MARSYGIDRFCDPYGLAKEQVRKHDEAEAARVKVQVGLGNIDNPPIGSLNLLRSASARVKKYYLGPKDAAVYVIGEERPTHVKIGFADDPYKRLKSLQTGNPHKMYIHRMFWLRSRQVANQVEFAVHRIAEMEFERTEGEWFECSARQAHLLIEREIDRLHRDCAIITPLELD